MKKVLSVLAGSIVLFGFASFALAAPFDYYVSNIDYTGTATTTQTISPQTYSGAFTFPIFVGNGDSSGFQNFGLGSGIATAGNTLSVTPFSIETTDGHLSDTLSIINSSLASLPSLSSSVSFLGSSVSTINTLDVRINNNLFGTSTDMTCAAASTTSCLMTKAQATKINALSATTSVSYEGSTAHLNSFPIFKSATVGSGVAVFNLTADGTSGGTALCTNGVIQDSVNANANDATASYQWSYVFSNSNKTVTITVNKLTTANILTGLLGQTAANGAVVKMSVYCY